MPIEWAGLSPELPLSLHRGRAEPLRSQLERGLREAIRSTRPGSATRVAVGGRDAAGPEPAVISAARERSIGLYGMSGYRSSGATEPRELVVGFGNLGERSIRQGIAAIGDLLRGQRQPGRRGDNAPTG